MVPTLPTSRRGTCQEPHNKRKQGLRRMEEKLASGFKSLGFYLDLAADRTRIPSVCRKQKKLRVTQCVGVSEESHGPGGWLPLADTPTQENQ